LYKGNKYYVPQLYKDIAATFDKNQNPALEFCEAKYWLAYKEGKLAGRIAGIINHKFIAQWQQPYVLAGLILLKMKTRHLHYYRQQKNGLESKG
jgi:hypothetical protein